ncbi:fibronectin type III domain-containing protein [Williamwhitmania taraxaci]|uniref:Por secretion system C-terminal sorting domain-containing protein n=1 Tax=Williamwhitmania taraxaci TaxID=1640674 RepID=A0A1G6T828_9BACT|nr:fibronectin type III domain-containing protein [Williamwhitmania taraxaci]SDD25209.1 Por secretion system C-terminal sorting domain-containing protein [Williamwhitmania taraxaci]
MKNVLFSLLCIAMVVLVGGNASAIDNLTASIPKTEKSKGYLMPMKAGSSTQFQVQVKCNVLDTFTVSINKETTFGGCASWFTIDVNSFVLTIGQTATFLVTVSPPAGTIDYTYHFRPYFKTNDRYGNDQSFDLGRDLSLIIDNTPPEILAIRQLGEAKSTSVSFSWDCADSRSDEYTSATNKTVGVMGIRSYGIALRNQNGATVDSKSYDATLSNNLHTFTVQPNAVYTPVVSAVDLAGNSSAKAGVAVTTPPAAPANLAFSNTDYCSTTLSWTASPGATRYRVYDATKSPATEIYTTAGTSYTVTGLKAGTTYKYYATAVGAAGVSPSSSVVSVATLTIPKPIITGPSAVCSLSNATYTVTNMPSGCSVSWSSSLNIVCVSGQSSNSYVVRSNDNGAGFITATIISCGGSCSNTCPVVVGSPTPGPISIRFDAPPKRCSASIAPMLGATSYRWYVDGVLEQDELRIRCIFDRQLHNCGHVYYVDVAAVNACGVSEISHAEVSETPCENDFRIFPNPASDNVTLTIGGSENTASFLSTSTAASAPFGVRSTLAGSYTIRILDNYGMLKVTLKSSGEPVVIPVGSYNNGVYIVEINDGKRVSRQQLLVKH